MIKKIKFLIAFLLITSSVNAQDVIDTLLFWPLDESLNDSYTFFEFDNSEVDTAIYSLGNGGINDISTPFTSGGLWRLLPTGYIEFGDYFEVNMTSKSDPGGKQLELTSIEFQMASRFASRPIRNFFLAYSLNSDFSDSTIVYNYPDGDLSTTSIPSPGVFNYSFENPIVLQEGESVYFRFYPYNAFNETQPQMVLIKNTFFIKGIVRDQSLVSSVDGFDFSRTCVSEGQVNWSLPGGFDNFTDTIVVFAKKTSLIDQGTPSFDPNLDYGTPITDLDSLDGSVPSNEQYQNDSDAMLIYRGTGTSVDLTNFEDGSTYYFAAFNVEGDGAGNITYSNAALASGASPDDLEDVSGAYSIGEPNNGIVYWTRPDGCSDSILVVVNTAEITYDPATNLIADYTANTDYTASDNYFNGTDASDGRVVFAGDNTDAENVTITDLTNGTKYFVTIWNYANDVWSPGVSIILFPNVFEAIFTQVQSEGTDFAEFLTLTEIDFDALQYNLSNYSACSNGRLYSGGGNALPTGRLDTLNTIPAGTFVRVYSSTEVDTVSSDGIVIASSTNWALKAVGGDQVMLYTGTGGVGFNTDCTPGTTSPDFLAGFNYGNAGWLEPGSGTTIDANTSYAPPSVSNLEMPATSTPNFSLKDQTSISGDVDAIHSAVSNVSSNWSTGTGSSPAIKLKNIKFSPSTINGSGFAAISGSDVKITLKDIITVTDSVDVRYMVVACAGTPPDNPVDRYTCYDIDLDYDLADTVVTAVSGQFTSSGTPCGTARTLGNGRIMYLAKDTAAITLTNLPCGSRIYVSLYAVKGNGITADISSAITESVLLPTGNTIYYSTGTGVFDDPGIWNDQADGLGNDFSGELTDCISLVVQNTDTITFDQDVLFGNLTINSGGKAILDNNNLTLTKNLTANDSLVTTDSRIIMAGLRQQNNINGSGYIELFELEVDNTNSTVGQDKLRVQTNIAIREGIFITAGDLEVTSGDTVTLLATPTTAAQLNQSAFLGEIPAGSTVSGTFSVERYLPTINTDAPGGSAQGVGWRYITSTVVGGTYEQMMDDFTCTGFTGSQYPDYGIGFTGYYFPNLQKYNEAVEGDQSFGFDGDYFSGLTNVPTTAPDIRDRRDKTEVISPGQGIFAYIGPVAQTFDFIGTPNTGDIDVNLTYTDNLNVTEDGWNLIANPYPCAVRMLDVGTTGGNVDGTIYIYNAETGIFQSFNRFGVATTLAAGQAFWAKVSSAGSPTMNFEEAAKVENSKVRFYKTEEQFDNSLIVHMSKTANPVYADLTTIWFNNDATNSFDNQYDGYKLYSLIDNVSGISSTIDGFDADVSINAIPELTEEMTIPIKVNIRSAGNYTISFEQYGDYILSSCLSLYDNVEDTTISVDMSTSYTFYSALRAETEEARFLLTMSPPISVSTTDATCYNAENGSAVATGGGVGPYTYTWYDADMTEIESETVNGSSTLSDVGQGFYTVVIEGDNLACASQTKGFFISQPAALENAFTTDDPSCNENNGYINMTLDTAATWNLTWTNLNNGQNGQSNGNNEYYTIGGLSYGDYEVLATSECGTESYLATLEDLNPVIADFITVSDTVYLVDGEIQVEFTNASENANAYSWFYADDQMDEDNAENGSYVFTEAGIYGVSLLSMNENGCYDDVTHELVVLDPTGINDVSSDIVRSYIAYGSGNPQYVIELKEAKAVQIQMVNSMGQVISSQQVNVNGKTMVDLPTYDLSSGIYIIITLDDGTRIDTKKLFVR